MRVKDEKKLENIMEATIKLVNEIGLHNTSMSKIARQAGVSPATIYVYFNNKEEMILETYLLMKEKMANGILKNLNPEQPVKEVFREMWINALDYMTHQYNYFVFCEQLSNSPLIDEKTSKKVEEYFKPGMDLFERGKNEKVLKNVADDLLILFFYYPAMMLVKSSINNNISLSESEYLKAFEMSWDAIAR